MPASKANWATTRKRPAATTVSTAETTGENRIPAAGATSPSSAIAAKPSGHGAERRGSSSSTVAMAAAWISGPDMRRSPLVDDGCTSWTLGAEVPTTTIRSRSSDAGTVARPSPSTSENE